MLFVQTLSVDPAGYFIWVFIVLFSICCHEYAHAQAALWQGDSTAYDRGHLTLNPFKQMGVISIITLLIIGISWGAVPVNPNRMKHKYSEALVAFAGPFTNLLLFLVFSAASAATPSITLNPDISYNLHRLFFTGAMINMVLLVFNLIPIPPLDGWGILSTLFPNIHKINPELKHGIMVALFILVIYSFNILYSFGYYATIYTSTIATQLLKAIGV